MHAIFFLIGASLVTALEPLQEKKTGKEESGEPNVETVLGWLPEDTESIIVAPAFKVDLSENPDASMGAGFLRHMTVSAFLIPGQVGPNDPGPAGEAMKGARLRLGLKAARRFTFPGGLGSVQYEGCDVAVFERTEDAGKVWDAVKKLGKTKSKGLAAETFVFEEKLERANWTFYITRPRENVLLCATQEKYLGEVLERMTSKAKGSLLETLKGREEWKVVNHDTSPAWAIRLFRRDNAKTDPGSPLNAGNVLGPNHDDEARATGFSLAKDGRKLDAWYFTGAKDALTVGRGLWLPPGFAARTELKSPTVVRFEFDLSGPDESGMRDLIILVMTGHVLYL